MLPVPKSLRKQAQGALYTSMLSQTGLPPKIAPGTGADEGSLKAHFVLLPTRQPQGSVSSFLQVVEAAGMITLPYSGPENLCWRVLPEDIPAPRP
jgi:hypothetical protein